MVTSGSLWPLETPSYALLPSLFKLQNFSPVAVFPQNNGGFKKLYQNAFIWWGGKTCEYIHGYEYYLE